MRRNPEATWWNGFAFSVWATSRGGNVASIEGSSHHPRSHAPATLCGAAHTRPASSSPPFVNLAAKVCLGRLETRGDLILKQSWEAEWISHENHGSGINKLRDFSSLSDREGDLHLHRSGHITGCQQELAARFSISEKPGRRSAHRPLLGI